MQAKLQEQLSPTDVESQVSLQSPRTQPVFCRPTGSNLEKGYNTSGNPTPV